ncbi:MAG: hypothetical protein QM754_04890 [Tepidisphaeraceae bacterium]
MRMMLLQSIAAVLLLAVSVTRADEAMHPIAVTWESAAIGRPIKGELINPVNLTGTTRPLVIYQKNLSVPRLGTESDETILKDFVQDAVFVLVLDYEKDKAAVSPTLNADALKLRQDLAAKQPALLAELKGKINTNRVFIVAEGNRLAQNVEFAKDGKRTLGLDIVYPSKPAKPVPMLVEFSCDNAERMGIGSLLFCRDTLVDGAQYAGFAAAMADHPVAPPYKGFDDPMPAVFNRARDAVYAAWTFAGEHGLGVHRPIGIIGFSRGGPIAAMTAMNSLFRSHAANEDVSEKAMMQPMVGAALVHGNRYDYLDLLPNDPMIDRFKKKWGDPATQPSSWAVHSAVNYIGDPKRIAPMFLNTSRKESPEYQDGLAKFDKKLTELGVEHVYQVDADDRGHRVSTDPKTLAAIYDFFAKHLKGDPK